MTFLRTHRNFFWLENNSQVEIEKKANKIKDKIVEQKKGRGKEIGQGKN